MAGEVLEVWQRTACLLRHVMQSVQMTDRLILSPTVSISMLLQPPQWQADTGFCCVNSGHLVPMDRVDFISPQIMEEEMSLQTKDKLSIKHAGSLQPCPKRGGVFSFPENMELVFILCSWLAQLDPDSSSRYC